MEYKSTDPSIAVIGTGYWGKNLVRNFSALGTLRVIVDTNSEILDRMARDYPDAKITASYSEVLNDPAIKGLAIATPAETHGALIREALLAGKDVFVEKPLCLSEDEGRELIQLAEERNMILMVGHLLWYHPALLRLKALVNNGDLGRIRYIYSNRLNMGKLRREENVLWSFAPHDVSVILGLVEEMPESVQAQGGNYLHQRIADVTVSLLSFDSGIKAHIFVSWLHPFKEQKLVVVGNEKMAVFDDTAPWGEKLTLYPHHVAWHGNVPLAVKAEAEPVVVEQEEPLRAECAHFIHCMSTRERPRTDGKEGLQVLRVLNACQRALKENEAVPLLDKEVPVDQVFVHPTALVDNNVTIGPKTHIWHFSHILSGSVIGGSCNIGQNVVIGPRAHIGKGCKIQNNISIYEGVTLEDYVFCGPSVVFTNVFNPRAEIPRMKELRPTLVRRGATLGANCTIVCGITIGRYAFLGAGATVTRDVPDLALVVGNPARQIGWMCKCGERLGDDLVCPVCSAVYQESEGGLEPIESLQIGAEDMLDTEVPF
ncbi:MAG: Gfo/Idh/MocA family oxidoreductase [Deltaproteobacteria bacterium]|nr:Gfo/Idh/MocA family oxidoreductase [Deltaproteobacteria bacterium]MBW1964728.1 Gfo/Idh/MocA family oxidoreductase [Deltaproteobacteria bacterium]